MAGLDKDDLRCGCADVEFLIGSLLLDDNDRDKALIARDPSKVSKPNTLGLLRIEQV